MPEDTHRTSGRYATAQTLLLCAFAAAYFLAEDIGGTLPALVVAGVSYRALMTRAR